MKKFLKWQVWMIWLSIAVTSLLVTFGCGYEKSCVNAAGLIISIMIVMIFTTTNFWQVFARAFPPIVVVVCGMVLATDLPSFGLLLMMLGVFALTLGLNVNSIANTLKIDPNKTFSLLVIEMVAVLMIFRYIFGHSYHLL